MGNLIVFVIPKHTTNNKTCQTLEVPLKPLNLHERIDSIDDKVMTELALSEIKISGKFSLSDAHSWISNCLPDVPPNVSQGEDN
jgi:Bardet-Biedl syndrome 7 protein